MIGGKVVLPYRLLFLFKSFISDFTVLSNLNTKSPPPDMINERLVKSRIFVDLTACEQTSFSHHRESFKSF
jgi:hypothetical protein